MIFFCYELCIQQLLHGQRRRYMNLLLNFKLQSINSFQHNIKSYLKLLVLRLIHAMYGTFFLIANNILKRKKSKVQIWSFSYVKNYGFDPLTSKITQMVFLWSFSLTAVKFSVKQKGKIVFSPFSFYFSIFFCQIVGTKYLI